MEWVPPEYEERTIPAHYESGIIETREKDGFRCFTDDPMAQIFVPEKKSRS